MFHFVDTKRSRILQAALTVFLTYGFKKTSMDDIAREAGVSRPALYQSFKNKTDIFRALSRQLTQKTLAAVKKAFDEEGRFREQLFKAIDTSIMELHRFCDQSPHGKELMGINQEIARDIELEWKEQMIAELAAGIQKSIDSKTADLGALSGRNVDATAIARIIMHAMEGMRETYLNGSSIDTYVEEMIDFVAYAVGK